MGFNIDPQFSRVVDGLILVDLAKTNPVVLEKYLGKAGADFFLSHQQTPDPADHPPRPRGAEKAESLQTANAA